MWVCFHQAVRKGGCRTRKVVQGEGRGCWASKMPETPYTGPCRVEGITFSPMQAAGPSGGGYTRRELNRRKPKKTFPEDPKPSSPRYEL